MNLTPEAAAWLTSKGETLGLAWQSNTRKTRGSDEVLNICIGDGIAPTKVDGWIHACTLTAKSMIKYAADPDAGLDIVGTTSWIGGNSALRYARWQADFHWKIDTRPWQFFLYMYTMKWAFQETIKEGKELREEDREALLEVNERFWEEVVVAYSYRSETIERSRKFAPHPDPTCGAAWQGYPYRKIWDRDDPDFEDLAMPFIEKGKSEYERVEGKVEPKPFPALENQMEPGIPTICWDWIKEAKKQGASDSWLRVPLGTRIVPTRFNGWWASLEELLRFVKPYSEGKLAQVQGASKDANGNDLSDYAVRFALCHAELQRRLKGEPEQLIQLIKTSRVALRQTLADGGTVTDKVDEFVEKVQPVIRDFFARESTLSAEDLPELSVVRPLHPRFAPPDPLEPLPWEVRDTARYLKKMAQLGYTI